MTPPTTTELSDRFGGTWTASPLRWSGVVDRIVVNLWSENSSGGVFVAIAISESGRKVCEIEGPNWSLVVETSLELSRRHDSLAKPFVESKEDL